MKTGRPPHVIVGVVGDGYRLITSLGKLRYAESAMFLGVLAPRTEVRGSIPGLDELRKSAPCRARTVSFEAGMRHEFRIVPSLELNSSPA
jgi:hypothetical protein